MTATNKNVLLNTLSQFGGKLLTIVASFIVVKLITQYGLEFYGEYLTSYEFLAFFGILADAGLFAIAVREMSRTPKQTEQILGNVLTMRLVFVAIVMVIAGVAAQFVPTYSPLVKIGIWITALSMGLTIFAGTLSSVLQAKMKIHYFSGSMVLAKTSLAIFIFLVSRYFLGGENLLLHFLWAGVASNVIFAALVTYFASREVKIRLHWDWDFMKNTLKVSLPYGLALILQTLYLRLDIILISFILGATAVGTYGAATRIMESLLVLGVYFGQSMLPKITAEESNHKAVGKSLVWAGEKLLLIALPIIIGLEVFAPEIIKLITSDEFITTGKEIASDSVLRILVPTAFFAFFNQLFSFTLVAKNRQNYLLIVNATALILNAGLNIFLIPRYGIIAAAISTVFCEIIVFALLTREVHSHWKLPYSPSNIIRIVGLNALLILEVLFTPAGQNLWLGILVLGATYIAGVLYWRNEFFPKHQPLEIANTEDLSELK